MILRFILAADTSIRKVIIHQGQMEEKKIAQSSERKSIP